MSYDPAIAEDEWDEIVVDPSSDDATEEGEDNVGEGALDEVSEVTSEVDAYQPDADPVYFETPSGDVIDIANPELNYEEAKELTDHIRATADMMYVLISRAHAGKAWKALGYESFKEYVKEEFNISRSRAYQLLDQARVVEEITAAVPEGTEVRITEADARDLKSTLDELVPEIRDRTANLDEDEDAGDVIEDLVRQYRERQNEEDDLGGDGESYPEEYEGDMADRQGFADYSGGGSGFPEDDDLDDDDIDDLLDFDEDPADVRRKFESVYALYTSLGALKEMPSVEEVIPWIPPERKMQVTSSLPQALAWLQEFAEVWGQEEGHSGTGDNAEDDEPGTEESSDFTSDDDDVEDLFEEFS